MIRVLIIDDDKLARKGLQLSLPWKEYGMEVVGEVANGAKALDFIKENPVDLCFVDLMMPVMNGLEFIQKAKKKFPHMQFVILTFHEDFTYAQSALRMGVIDYISKLELEHADFGAILKRITKKLKQKDGKGGEFDEKEMSGWEKKLLQKYWLYNGKKLEELIDQLGKKNLPLPMVERSLFRASLEIEADTGLKGLKVPHFENQQEAKDFLFAYREDILQKVQGNTTGCHLAVCLLKAVCIVEKDVAQNLHTETVAGMLCLSRPYFSAVFTKAAGISFGAFVRQERMKKAMTLLEKREWTVGEIAPMVGYEDIRSFSKAFQEVVGYTPSKHREKNKNT